MVIDKNKFAEDVFNEIKQQALKLIPKDKKVVLGVSGGKDSTITLKLLKEIIGLDRVIPVLLPNGVQKDIEDSREVCRVLGVEPLEINIQEPTQSILKSVSVIKEIENNETYVNIQPRTRMSILRAIASEYNAILCGTGNASEALVGYFTKDGDGAFDINLIADLTTEELYILGSWLGEIPDRLVNKTPSDGLSGKSDEEKLGISYKDIHSYLRGTEPLTKDVMEKIRNKRVTSQHKKGTKYGTVNLTKVINKHYKDLRDELLLVIDLQNDFLENGNLQANDPRLQEKTENAINSVTKHFREDTLNTLFTFDNHTDNSLDYIQTEDSLRVSLSLHCNTPEGISLPSQLSHIELNEDNSVHKQHFGSLDTVSLINEIHKGKDIRVIGAVLDYCVLTHLILLRTYFPDIEITLDDNSCLSSGNNEEVLLNLLQSYDIKVIR